MMMKEMMESPRLGEGRKRRACSSVGNSGGEEEEEEMWRSGGGGFRRESKLRRGEEEEEEEEEVVEVVAESAGLVDLFDGAVYVVTQQLEKTVSTRHCAVCRRAIEDEEVMECATETFVSSLATLRLRRTMLLGGSTMQYHQQNHHAIPDEEPSSSSLAARKLGYLTYLRQIKHDSLRDKECVVCQRGFSGSQSISPLLSHIDRLLDICNSRNAADPSW